MAQTALLHFGSGLGQASAFTFDHVMEHRKLLGGMSPLDRFSVLPYFLDPFANRPDWHMNHQQAHNDGMANLPSWFGETTVGIPTNKNVIDTNLDIPRKKTWWMHVNKMEHQIASSVLQDLVYPFW